MAKLKLNFLENIEEGNQKTMISILQEYAEEIVTYSGQYFKYSITTGEYFGVLTDFSMYIIASKISYEYKAIEVEIINVSEVKITFLFLITKQKDIKKINISNGVEEFEKIVASFLSSKSFNSALKFLVNQIYLRQDYKEELKKSIVIGEARTIRLESGEEINAGFYKIDGEKVYFYTGKGLRELFRPGMLQEDKLEAQKIQDKGEDYLLENKYLDFILISKIKEIF